MGVVLVVMDVRAELQMVITIQFNRLDQVARGRYGGSAGRADGSHPDGGASRTFFKFSNREAETERDGDETKQSFKSARTPTAPPSLLFILLRSLFSLPLILYFSARSLPR